MNVWIDLGHIPQYNFYKPIILDLAKKGNKVYITYIRRGRMPVIIQNEIGKTDNIYLYEIGVHRMNRISVLLEANLLRNIQLLFWKIGKKIDVILSNTYPAAMVGWIFRIPSYSFDDDPQTIHYWPKLFFNKKTHYCIYEYHGKRKLSPKAIILPVLKEWSYLSPSVFKPNISVLEKYGVKPKEYLFLREVSVGTMNYVGQNSGAIYDIKDLIPKDKKVLFSLEEKGKRELYPKEWILLQEPLDDVHSLIYYSSGLVSSGDSMAREAAMLGVPSYYLGIRQTMPANLSTHKVAGLQSANSMSIKEWLQNLSSSKEKQEQQQFMVRENVSHTFIDISQYILGLLQKEYAKG